MQITNPKCRSLIFISHANPADNDFTTWLGSRLSAMGYRVWADLSNLRGGSKHWRVIERKIRSEAVKVLVVTTYASRAADGVDNEINIAMGIEKELALEDFIIQLKVDDLPYTQLPPVLNNRLAISFNGDWGEGLCKLAKQLDEERIPKTNTDATTEEMFSTVLNVKSEKLIKIQEPAFASWLPIHLPERLYVYTFPGTAKVIQHKLHDAQIPAYSFANTLISFAIPDTVSFSIGEAVKHLRNTETATKTWLDEQSFTNFAIQRKERRRTFNGLLNSAWEIMLKERGFREYQISHERAYFIPSTDRQLVKQKYYDPMGRNTRPITLVGESRKYSSLWHAAVSARASLNPIPLYSIRLHVAFTDDGITPIADGAKAFRLRKTFCKSFWNDRWRRILFALFSLLTDGNDEIKIGAGGEESIKVRFPVKIGIPYSIESDLAVHTDECEEDDITVEVEDSEFYADFDGEDEGDNDK